MKTVLVTGSAGFIGNAVAHRLLGDGHTVIGLDNLNDYYDPSLKEARLERLTGSNRFHHFTIGLEERDKVLELFETYRPEQVVHLAAQAGVRHSLNAPQDYVDSNITGFLSILEACRAHKPEHLVFASTSSVFGLDKAMPLSEHRGGNHPVSLYAATKKANEAMAHSYAHLFNIPMTGLRFFTVYGPWGRPDMALFKFTKAILEDRPVPLFNNGEMVRDFTYVDDIVEGIVRLAHVPATADQAWDPEKPDPSISAAPYRICNIGNSSPVQLMDYLEAIEEALGKKAEKEFLPMQPGDVHATWADTSSLEAITHFKPATPVRQGVKAFVDWYRDYYNV